MIDGIPLADFTAPTLLGVGILLVMFGRLVPWWFYKAKAEEAEKWRLAYEAERTARVSSDAQTKELLEFANTDHAILMALFGGAELTRKSGEAYVVPTPAKN